MAEETPIHVFVDNDIVARMDRQQERWGWSRKEIVRRLIQDALPRLEAATPPLTPAK